MIASVFRHLCWREDAQQQAYILDISAIAAAVANNAEIFVGVVNEKQAFPCIDFLCVDAAGFDDRCAQQLQPAVAPRLRRCTLDGCTQLTFAGFKRFMRQASGLESLSLARCTWVDDRLADVLTSKRLPALTELRLDATMVSGSALK